MADIRIEIRDTGNDTVDARCSDDTVNAVLSGKASPFVQLTGAQQLALVMSKAARDYLANITATRLTRGLKILKKH